jgi:hypothetical protein
MNIQELARRREVQILAAFGVVTLTAYYFWLKKQKEGLGWANASGKTSKTAGCPTGYVFNTKIGRCVSMDNPYGIGSTSCPDGMTFDFIQKKCV